MRGRHDGEELSVFAVAEALQCPREDGRWVTEELSSKA